MMKRSAARQKTRKLKRQAILVLGMHRSGTSALSGVACALGASAPNNLLPANFANPSGYWESLPLVEATDELLASAGSSWDDWRKLDPQWYGSNEARHFHDRLLNIVKSEYDENALFIVKDPRLCRLMPFFSSILEEMTAAPVALLSIRDPLEVAFSLRRRDNFSISKSVALWLRHVLEAEFHSRQMPRCFISYESLLKDWRLEMRRASDATGIAWPVALETAAISNDRFLATDLHHERNETAEVERDPDLLFLAAETYDLLRAASRAEQTVIGFARSMSFGRNLTQLPVFLARFCVLRGYPSLARIGAGSPTVRCAVLSLRSATAISDWLLRMKIWSAS